MKISLAGNPNSGKTTLFNQLTGSNQYVGNWPGVTVEKKEGRLKNHKDVTIVDLPGIYSLSPYTLEEVVARNFLINEKPDLIINIIDSSNIERNLYLTTQLAELNIPMVLACNMSDVIEKNGTSIDYKKLSSALGIPTCPISAAKNIGVDKLIEVALNTKNKPNKLPIYNKTIIEAIDKTSDLIKNEVKESDKYFYSIKLLERDVKVLESIVNKPDIGALIKNIEEENDDDIESVISGLRYDYITSLIDESVTKKNVGSLSISDKIDKVVTNRILALPIFVLVMGIVYYVSISTVGTMATDWVNDVLFGDIIPPMVSSFLESINTAEWLSSLIVDGIIAGVGAVLGFLPQMLVLFFFLAILEECGYMARIAFIMDRIFRRFGLSGKSFIPMLIGTGCSVPAIMASRTIESERDRKMTIMTTSFIVCGAKLPIVAFIAGALFDNSGWMALSAYFIGVFAVITSGIILKKLNIFKGDPAPFVMELPAYHLPSVKNVASSMWERGTSFVKKAGTVILLATILIWFFQAFSLEDGSIAMVDMENSFLAMFGNMFAWIFTPLGWGDWKAAVAALTGLVAKETVVSTFGILYGFEEVAEDGVEIWSQFAASFTAISAYSFMIFNLLCAPCFAAIGAIKREMNNTGWTLVAIAYQCILAYAASLAFYQVALLVTGGPITIWSIVAIALIVCFVYLLVKPSKDSKLETKAINAK